MNNDNNPPKDPMDQFMPMDNGGSADPTQPITPAPSDPVTMPSGSVPPLVADPVMPTFSQPESGAMADASALPQAADPISFNPTPSVAQPDPSSAPISSMDASMPPSIDAVPAEVNQPSTGDPVLDELHKIENKFEEMDEKL